LLAGRFVSGFSGLALSGAAKGTFTNGFTHWVTPEEKFQLAIKREPDRK
jgi:hypothetical protein